MHTQNADATATQQARTAAMFIGRALDLIGQAATTLNDRDEHLNAAYQDAAAAAAHLSLFINRDRQP